jgi:glycosyltransferase involved in cell wall biosynthesis
MQTLLEGKVALLIPCFNEQACIGAVLAALTTAFPHYDRIVIDDGSSDDSAHTAAKGAVVVRLPVNLGIGGAVQAGILYARDKGYDYCIQVDGDGQHPPDAVQAVINSYSRTPANLTIGSRFLMPTTGFKSTLFRRLGISIIRSVIRRVTGQRITDPTSGLRLMDRAAIEIFADDYPPDFPEPISIAIAFESGLTIQEAHVAMKERVTGTSSIGGMRNVSYMVRVCAYLVAVRLRGIF